MKTMKSWLIGLAVLPLSLLVSAERSQASLVTSEWFHGNWNCTIDGRPARMQWYLVDDPQTRCNGNVCSTTSGVRLVGRFSDNGSAWVPLARRWSRGSELGIRYLGREQDNWFLSYNSRSRIASGWTTWRGTRYPLSCQKVR